MAATRAGPASIIYKGTQEHSGSHDPEAGLELGFSPLTFPLVFRYLGVEVRNNGGVFTSDSRATITFFKGVLCPFRNRVNASCARAIRCSKLCVFFGLINVAIAQINVLTTWKYVGEDNVPHLLALNCDK